MQDKRGTLHELLVFDEMVEDEVCHVCIIDSPAGLGQRQEVSRAVIKALTIWLLLCSTCVQCQ